MRLGLRAGEVYAISHRQVRARQIIVDQSVQRGYKERPAMVVTRKNDEAYVLDVSQDVIDAIAWHVRTGFAGPEFLFSKDGEFYAHLTRHRWPLRRVQKALGLRELGIMRSGGTPWRVRLRPRERR